MLSEETKKRLLVLQAAQSAYLPAASVRRALQAKTLIMLVAATGMGKSTIMRELTALRADISMVGTITTRPARPDDDLSRYTFYHHSDDGLAPLLDQIDRGELVQYVINPRSLFVYGSSLGDYKGGYSIGDYFSSVVADFPRYGFSRIVPVSIVTEPSSWKQRFEERFGSNHPERKARRDEAIDSLNWSLKHQDELIWIINRDEDIRGAAQALDHALTASAPHKPAEVISLAERCLKTIRETTV